MPASKNLRALSIFLLILFGFKTGNASIYKIFKKYEKVALLRSADIISTHHVHSEMDCSFGCGKEPTCVGFKYKYGASSQSVNCQLSNTTGVNDMTDDDNQGWVYFVDIKSKLVTQTISAIETLTTTPTGKSCLDIKEKGFSQRDGIYLIDPDGEGGGNPFEVECDMKSFGGGWTMCYTTDSHVDIRTELTTTADLGYRADCNNITFTGVIFVDEASKQKAVFNNNGTPVTFFGNYNKKADVFGFWTAQGVASTAYRYQMLICDMHFIKGLYFSGYTNCYKKSNDWCGDTSSPYFRTSAVSDQNYNGVAFNENGHRPRPKKLISVGIR